MKQTADKALSGKKPQESLPERDRKENFSRNDPEEPREAVSDIRPLLNTLFSEAGIPCTPKQADQLQRYMELLIQWNQKMNLTAITEPEQVAVKHFLDSGLLLQQCLLVLGMLGKGKQAAEISGEGILSEFSGKRLIDVGTGAGFPGLVLKILCPDLQVTLLDSLQKRLTFLGEVAKELELTVDLVHARAEEGGRMPSLRCGFDFATARAVAPMNLLAEYCLPFVKEGGWFLALKGPGIKEELEQARGALGQLGGALEVLQEYTLPGGDQRVLAGIRRVKPLSSVYPRPTAKIKKKPL